MRSEEAIRRRTAKLESELGSRLRAFIADPDITEVMLNPDGRLWTEGFQTGLVRHGTFEAHRAEALIGTVADCVDTVVTRERPIVSGLLPIANCRFEGLLPPVVARPCFTLRKPALKVFSLDDYLADGALSAQQALSLRNAVARRANILIAGGTGSGKTTLANALIAEIARLCPDDRLVLLEDTPEIQCLQANHVRLLSTDTVDMTALLRSTLRQRPDRILIGEVRGGEALALLKSWNTGHPGGLATIHANSAAGALTRLEHLIGEATPTPMRALIDQAVDLVVFIEKTEAGRHIREIASTAPLGKDLSRSTVSSLPQPLAANRGMPTTVDGPSFSSPSLPTERTAP